MDTVFDESNDLKKTERLKQAMLALAADRELCRSFPDIAVAAAQVRNNRQNEAIDEEISFLNLYCALHGAGSGYSLAEREILDEKKGYFNHPGGISPLLKAEGYILSDSIIADLGAGNGLQGLLFHYLYPHACTMQVELSAEMIEIGRRFQKILGIPDNKIEWINTDILNISLETMDFLYLYRPSKPQENGVMLYKEMSRKLSKRTRPLTIFSIADCLKDFLNSRYQLFYSDGHLTCFHYPGARSADQACG